MGFRAHLGAWLEAARLSNLPTAWSNTLTGLGLGYAVAGASGPPPFVVRSQAELLGAVLREGLPLFVGVSLFYAAGMLLNDLLDRRVDATERPTRPIPSGRLRPAAVLGAVALFLGWGIGIVVAAYSTAPLLLALLLVAAIVGYDWLHKRWPMSVALMGVCRGLLYLLGAGVLAAVDDPVFWAVLLPSAGVLFVYVILLTVVARVEAGERMDRRRWLSLVMVPLVLTPALFIQPTGVGWAWAALAATVLVAWLGRGAWLVTRRPPRTGHAVLSWLAGICLIDAWVLTLLGLPLFAAAAGGCFILTVAWHRWIVGT